jgi:hypothetical protein
MITLNLNSHSTENQLTIKHCYNANYFNIVFINNNTMVTSFFKNLASFDNVATVLELLFNSGISDLNIISRPELLKRFEEIFNNENNNEKEFNFEI